MEFKRDNIPPSFAFELSNRCNMAKYHPECPTVATDGPVFLNTDIIKDVLRYFGKVGHKGTLYFNVYNEPLIDPRLFMLLEFNKKHTECGVCLFTNGWGLDQHIADEITKLNASFSVSCYSDAILDRVSQLNHISCCSKITLNKVVKTIYQSPPGTGKGPCRFPSLYGLINHRGEYGMCCHDYEYHHILGDLKTNSIEEILESDYRREVCDRLEAGDRFLDACIRCPHPGWGVSYED